MKNHFIFLGTTFSAPSQYEKLTIEKLNEDSVAVTLEFLDTHQIPYLRGQKSTIPLKLTDGLTQDEAMSEFIERLSFVINNNK